jgi:hypothetical protein
MTIWIDYASADDAAIVLKQAKERVEDHIQRMRDAAISGTNKIRAR